MIFEQVIIIRSKTFLEELIQRFNSKNQAQFYLESTGQNFKDLVKDHHTFYYSLKQLKELFQQKIKYKVIDRDFLPNYIFTEKDLIIGIGQDGLIANIAKYVNGQPIVGFNPNPKIYDGVLLPFQKLSSKQLVRILNGEFNSKKVVMAQALFNDEQKLLAFNDFFIGPKSHTSARYSIHFEGKNEIQSSSGIIISTGAGATGWMSSILNMINGVGHSSFKVNLDPEKRKLFFIVREPFKSKTSEIEICSGEITDENKLIIESNMVENGMIFSDGIEADFIPFNVGSKVEISIANEYATLVNNKKAPF
ncbi:MAG: hypothetical protein RLN81_14275 [Balneolaceae bacterium]